MSTSKSLRFSYRAHVIPCGSSSSRYFLRQAFLTRKERHPLNNVVDAHDADDRREEKRELGSRTPNEERGRASL
jgi:hypothetical protein